MARIRSVHPGLFTDEAFVSLSPLARVLLVGLWTECDDQGIFEWKPITIKMRLLPVDNVDVSTILAEFPAANLVRKFTHGGREYGAVRNFCRYQRPKKPKCIHPITSELRTYVALTGVSTEPDEVESPPVPPNAEIVPQMKDEGGRMEKKDIRAVASATRPDRFEDFWKVYPKRDGANPKAPARKKFLAAVKSGVDVEEIIAAAKRSAEEARAKGQIGTPYVPQAMTWLGQQRWGDYEPVEDFKIANGFHAEPDSDELVAWEEYRMATEGKSWPRDKLGGWTFPTQWPPGYVPSSEHPAHETTQ